MNAQVRDEREAWLETLDVLEERLDSVNRRLVEALEEQEKKDP